MFRKQVEAKPVAPPEREPAPPVAPDRAAIPAADLRDESTQIAQSITVKGDLSGQEGLFFDGALEGRIHMLDSRVVIGPNGRVHADVEANEIVVEGQVRGNLRARTRVELRRTSHVRGDVTTERIAIQDGAHFNGRVEIVRGEEACAARAASVAASAESYAAVPVSAASPVPSGRGAGEPKDPIH